MEVARHLADKLRTTFKAEGSKQSTNCIANFKILASFCISLILNCQLHSPGDLTKAFYKYVHKQAIDYKKLQVCTWLL